MDLSNIALVRNASNLRRFMPFLMRKRNESIVFFEHTIPIEKTLEFIKSKNRDAKQKITLFHFIIAALNRLLFLRPRLNRFVLGHKIFERDKGVFSFAVKPAFNDNSEIRSDSITCEPLDTLDQVAQRVEESIAEARKNAIRTSEREVDVLLKIPAVILKPILFFYRMLQSFALIPKKMRQTDPLFASAFVANMGSIGVEAPFHHLYEHGGVSIFVAFGRIKTVPVADKNGQIMAQKSLTFRFSIDERIADGFYCAKSLRIFEKIMANPKVVLDEAQPKGVSEKV